MEIRYRRNLYKIVDLSLPGAELGVADGNFSRDILEWPISKLYLVDAWQNLNQKGDGGYPQEWHDENLRKTREKIAKYGDRAVILRGLTYLMAEQIPDKSLGFVNVDADHSEDGVLRDLTAWWPKLVKGGVLAMHDYSNADYGVSQAATKFFLPKGIQIHHLPEDKWEDAGAWVYKP
jgi:hypothetical protein